MKKIFRARLVGMGIVSVLIMGFVTEIQAVGHYVPGTNGGFDDAQMPPPGWAFRVDKFEYSASETMDNNGDKTDINFDLNVSGIAPNLHFTSQSPKLFGARFGVRVAAPYYLQKDIEISANTPGGPVSIADGKESGIGDINIAPFLLGWGGPKMSYTSFLGFSFFIPTGDFDASKDMSKGEGFWSYHLEAGGRIFLDSDKKWWSSAISVLSINGQQDGTNKDMGNELSIEYGVGRVFFSGPFLINPALAGFGYWQLTADDDPAIPNNQEESHVKYAVGPELAVIFLPKNLLIKARALYEYGVKNGPKGKNISITMKYSF